MAVWPCIAFAVARISAGDKCILFSTSLRSMATPFFLVPYFLHQLGAPAPGPLFLIAAGALAAAGKMHLLSALLLAVAACVLADWPWYEAGQLWGDRVLHFIHRFTQNPEAHNRRAREPLPGMGLPFSLSPSSSRDSTQ